MRNRIGLFFVALFLSVAGFAQDSVKIVPPVEEEVFAVDSVEIEQGKYMEEGYYDKVPKFQEYPLIDTAAFSDMSERYQNPEFNYDEDVFQTNIFERAWNRISRWIDNLLPDMGFLRFGDWFYKILAVIAIVGFIVIIYRVLFSGNRLFAHEEKEGEESSEIRFVEKNLLDVDISKYIEQALKDNNYALAIRYLNLLNIQLLAQRKVVKWKHTKTNMELLSEISDIELRRDFERNVAIFDRVWFGSAAIDRTKYEEYAAYFLQFQSRWK
ncbi:hypothetical protein SAMN05660206_103273 [Sphingobacterium wenxiniae]|uniref:DUF4129 domain-containing protein n=2 Tax=Sphingobacterium wenxiniae TaxID=683125 RepID=A0A1I6RAE3_9SPHI|nr:hypothetical protein SAMN05660206_103273 [Sphingobacterium wenxiniae]